MKIILLKDIKNIGKKYEIKEVSDGFARNYLIPQGIVKFANKENLAWLEVEQKKAKKQADEELKKVGELTSQIDRQEIEIKVKVGEEGQLFEKITENCQEVKRAWV